MSLRNRCSEVLEGQHGAPHGSVEPVLLLLKGVPSALEAGYVKGRLTDPCSKDFGCDQAGHMDILLPGRV